MAGAELAQGRRRLPGVSLSGVAVPIAAIVIAVLIGTVVIAVTGGDPTAAFPALVHGAVGTQNNLVATLVRAVPICVCGVGIAVALRAGAFNLGGEGQMVLGSLACAVAANTLAGLPGPLVTVLALAIGCLVGALYAFVPAILEVKLAVPILITSLLLNYIAALFAAWVANYPLRDLSGGGGLPQTVLIAKDAWLPIVLPGTRLYLGIVTLVILPLIVAWFFRRTVAGYELRALGANRRFARYGGVNVGRGVTGAMLASGAICGLAGSLVVLGVNHRYIDGYVTQASFAWSGFIAAILTGAAPIATVIAGLFLAALQVGAAGMTRSTEIPLQVVDVVQATIILIIAARVGLQLIIQRRLGSR
jgi:general nucleoside transport system permease protein